MYLKLVLLTCVLAFCAVVLSAFARLSDAGLGCANWPACYEENALKERQPPQAAQPGAVRSHTSWPWKLHGQVVQLLGLLTIAVCGMSWNKRRKLHQSPLLSTLLAGLMVFMAVFGVWAFSHLLRPVIVMVHLAGGVAMLMMLTWMALRQIATEVAPRQAVVEVAPAKIIFWCGMALLLVQIMLGGWVSSNFAATACTGFPLCQGKLLPDMDFSYSLSITGLPLTHERLTAIHWMHRLGALLVIVYLGWLSFRILKVKGLRNLGRFMLGLIVLELILGVGNVRLDLPLWIATLHNAVAMLMLVVLLTIIFKTQKCHS